MTGPADSIVLTAEPLDVGAAIGAVADERSGATDVFVGTTRRFTDDRETATLSYEAYEPMGEAAIVRIVAEARARWEILRCAVHHRTGTVAVGEASVVIAVSTRHRADAFDACRFLIDTLKDRVPIWKRESWTDGTSEWVGGEEPG